MIDKNLNIDYRELLQNSIDKNLENYIIQLNLCNEKFSEIAVHDIRVRIRRFLTLLSMIRYITDIELTTEIMIKLREQLRAFNPLRDVQVQLLKVQQMVYTKPVLYRYYHYSISCEEEYVAFLKDRLKGFDVKSLMSLILNLKLEIDRFYKDYNHKIIRPQDIACQRFNAVIIRHKLANKDDAIGIHKIRLSFKKFRYTMEIIQPLTNMHSDIFQEMSDFQTLLGNIQDYTVYMKKLGEFSEIQEQVSKEMFKPVEEELLFEREKLINAFFSHFDKIYSFWKPEYNSH